MKKELRDYLNNFNLINYRLTDGSNIIANEKHYDNESESFYISTAIELKVTGRGNSIFIPWILSEDDDIIKIHKDRVIASASVIDDIQIQYHRYLIKNNLQDSLTDDEINVILDRLFTDDLDNLDNAEFDGGIEALYEYEKPKDLEWRKKWKPYDN